MTKNRDLKALIDERRAANPRESYTTAKLHVERVRKGPVDPGKPRGLPHDAPGPGHIDDRHCHLFVADRSICCTACHGTKAIGNVWHTIPSIGIRPRIGDPLVVRVRLCCGLISSERKKYHVAKEYQTAIIEVATQIAVDAGQFTRSEYSWERIARLTEQLPPGIQVIVPERDPQQGPFTKIRFVPEADVPKHLGFRELQVDYDDMFGGIEDFTEGWKHSDW
jgi:hypothetical protein